MKRRAHVSTVRMLALICATLLAGAGAMMPVAHAEPPKPAAAAAMPGPDTLIFRDGRVLTGTVLSETATSVKFKGTVSGLAFETDYDKKDILKISKGERKADAVAPANGKTDPVKPAAAAPANPPSGTPAADGERYYWIDLEGTFGEQISQTPLREAIEDARKNNADTIIIRLDAEWKQNSLEKLPDDTANFDEVFRSEKLAEIFTDDVPKNWAKKPRVVFWVKQAMAGAALLPLVCPELYFHPDARLGGLGNLSVIFEGVGDDVVREKQRSLRLAHAEGWAIAGGYDPRLIRAMARFEYVLSYRLKDGKAELFEGYPSSADEFLLTDDGKESNADTVPERVTGEGNDVLTLKADTAYTLGVSKKTVETKEELLSAMGLDRNGVAVPGRSKQITKDWVSGIENTKRRLKKLRDEFGEVRVQPPADYAARTKARGQQIKILEDMKSSLKGKYGEGLTPRWLGQNGIPDEVNINLRLEQLKIQQLKDKK